MIKLRHLLIFLFICLLYSVGAYVIAGCIHHDEHFQILEFANYKRGLLDAKYLPWEFEARLRPTLQPTLALMLLNFFDLAGISDPFDQAFLTRLISSMLFVFSAFRLYRVLEKEFTSPFFKWVYILLSFFLYIFPLTATRFSSENWSSCFYVLAFSYLYPFVRRGDSSPISFKQSFIAGALFGLSFLFRYQTAIMIFGLALWLLIFHFKLFKYWLSMFMGFAFVLVIGFFLDHWFYGEWVSSAWNYFYVNLMEGKAASFGVEPWWWYLSKIDFSKYMIILNGALLLMISFFAFVKFRHPVTWVFFPFLIAHFLIGHKETRFLYPLLVFVPFMVSATLQYLARITKSERAIAGVVIPLLVINAFAVVATSVTPADNSTEIWKFIRTLPDKPILIYQNNPRFYYALNDGKHAITLWFYKDDHSVTVRNKNSGSGNEAGEDTLTYAVMYSGEEAKWGRELKPVFDPQPRFVKALNYRNWMRLSNSEWKVYSYNKHYFN
ncbi:hypothetical protein [Dyadobacter sp. CY312]|uniref:hypothetical protein n=1 Tax=Dyadobacter sp. CY312 TaxID=2907303 RepID=UPI001F222E4E|nr:hypothetical protein [Dyadobacter sp. CY312]MCE7040233.1 hypothetical protein [Dyadobacter sp. CY312]